MKSEKDMDSLLQQARKAFQRAEDHEEENRRIGEEDLRFVRNLEQWPEDMKRQREADGRPCLTIDKLNAFVRQVVNDARQNKPQIKVHPVDSGADIETAKVINGLIRNIERASKSDIAYDTAIECATANGFGYMRVGLDYAHDDVFDLDIEINRVPNPFSVYGDPDSTSADGSDWNTAFVLDPYSRAAFEKEWGDKAQVDWDHAFWGDDDNGAWKTTDSIMVAEWWTREDYQETIHQLSNGITVSETDLAEDEDLQETAALIELGMIQIVKSRKVTRKKVIQRIMTGAEILEENEWPGKYIPIVPVYGDEFYIGNERKLRSLCHNALDAQRMFNYWRSTSTELVALAPRVPYIGEEGAFDIDPSGWATANTVSHPYLVYKKGKSPPQRQPLDSGPAAGALQESLMASDDMKSALGMFDASLGAQSNETSGKAIMARQREGDVSTFHFIDNLSRAIRQLGNIILDLIPHVYNNERVIRVLGEDDKEETKTINAQAPQPEMDENGQPVVDEQGQAVIALHDLTAGKYDLTVTAGPSFTTRREEAAFQMTEALRSFPMVAPILLPIIAKNSDWPDADGLAEKLEAMSGAPDENAMPPQMQMMMQQMQEGMQQAQAQIQQLAQENEQLKNDLSIKQQEAQTKQYDAETKRLKVETDTQLNVIDRLTPAPTNQGVQQRD